MAACQANWSSDRSQCPSGKRKSFHGSSSHKSRLTSLELSTLTHRLRVCPPLPVPPQTGSCCWPRWKNLPRCSLPTPNLLRGRKRRRLDVVVTNLKPRGAHCVHSPAVKKYMPTPTPRHHKGTGEGGGGDLPEPSDLPNRCGLCRCMCWLGTRYRRLADKAEVAQMALEEEQANLVARKQDIEAREASLAAEEQALRGMKVRRQGIDLCRRVTHTHTRCGTQHHRRAVVMRGD